jgi:P27 family predicted phage terminase small subunit
VKKAPAHLSAEARRLWYKIARTYTDFDEYGFLVLRVALESFDRLQEARRAIEAEGVTYVTETGYKREHPALKTEKSSRDGFIAAIRLLGLNIDLPAGLGRPPGT